MSFIKFKFKNFGPLKFKFWYFLENFFKMASNLDGTFVTLRGGDGKNQSSKEKPEKSKLYSSKTGYGSRSLQEKMKALNTLNTRQRERTGHTGFGSKDNIGFDENQLALVTLSTIANMADNKVLEKNYYTLSRLYLENLTDNCGLAPTNVPRTLKAIEDFQVKNNIDVDDFKQFDSQPQAKSTDFDEKTVRDTTILEGPVLGKKVPLVIPEVNVSPGTPPKTGSGSGPGPYSTSTPNKGGKKPFSGDLSSINNTNSQNDTNNKGPDGEIHVNLQTDAIP